MATFSYFDPSKPEDVGVVATNMLWRISVSRYHAMIASGALTPDDPIELLQGWLVQKMPKSPKHSTYTRLIRELFQEIVPKGWAIDSQEPITTFDSEPEPDVVIIRGSLLDYAEHHPKAENVGLIVEVSDATLHRDRTIKRALYAAAGIPIYWIVNLREDQIEVYSDPSGAVADPLYRQQSTYLFGDEIPVLLENERIGVLEAGSLLID